MATQTEVIELAPLTVLPDKHIPTISTEAEPEAIQVQYPKLSPLRAVTVCVAAAGITAACSMTTGCLTTGLPAIADNLNLSDGLILWPAAIYSLTSGCTFILIGAIADVVGARLVYLFGCLFLALSVLACGLSQTAAQLIVFRGLQGIAASCCQPSAISILSQSFPPGRARTRALVILGAAFPFGFSLGLVLGGVFVETIGWRWGWYLTAVFAIAVFGAASWAIPKDDRKVEFNRILTEVDWVGAVLLSACLGLISYTLAILSDSYVLSPKSIALLVIGIVLGPVAFLWMARQEKMGKVALIPSSVWPNRYFSVICVLMFLVSAELNSLEYFFSLFFQKVKDISALQASLRFLPEIVIGAIMAFGTDAILHRWSTYAYTMVFCGIAAVAPLMMVFMAPQWSYWYLEFWAMVLLPVGNDVLFIVASVVITDTFPGHRQALAGSVLNAIMQFGTAVGLGTMAVASSVITADSTYDGTMALLEGYRVTFWACFGAALLSCIVGAWGLKGIGKIGLKEE